ncbi:MAG: protein-L-isoaspartate O-methyltransferase [Treponema sp.]|jgi:protein-L-isoaspartate(D-aspartate) O-methyltransferase|nr:protein-L-isoaspartate O-methyltransferase [Treponema sp.]
MNNSKKIRADLAAGVLGTALILVSCFASAQSERVVSYEEASAVQPAPAPVETAGQDASPAPEADALPAAHQEARKYDGPAFAQSMPIETRDAWLAWMRNNRSDAPNFLEERWKLAQAFVETSELRRHEDVRAFLLAPREHFVRRQNKGLEYADTWLPIGYGATITDPDVVAMMTTTLNIQPGEKVLEIGTGSGYQSAILSYLTSEVYTIEIIKPLFAETDALYREREQTYPSYGAIKRKLGDGYYGWEEYAPFDKIIVTCSIDHIPPALTKQLKPGGIMVLPLGPPGRQFIMEIRSIVAGDGSVTLKRRDVYNGIGVRFIPFRDQSGASYSTFREETP